jgi:hypothetical protein
MSCLVSSAHNWVRKTVLTSEESSVVMTSATLFIKMSTFKGVMLRR